MALDYPHWYIILSRLCISNNNPLGVPCIHFLLNTEKHTHAFFLLFPLTLHPFLAVPSCLFFSYLNLNSLLCFFISTHLFTCFLLVFAFLWCWCGHPREGRMEVMQSQQRCPLLQDLWDRVPFLALYWTSIKCWNNKCDPQSCWCAIHIQKTAGGVRLVGDVRRGMPSQQIPVQLSQGPEPISSPYPSRVPLSSELSHLFLESTGAQWAQC